MNGINHGLDRTVREDGKRRWTPRLLAGAVIYFAFTGLWSLGLMLKATVPPVPYCGIAAICVMENAAREMPHDPPVMTPEGPC